MNLLRGRHILILSRPLESGSRQRGGAGRKSHRERCWRSPSRLDARAAPSGSSSSWRRGDGAVLSLTRRRSDRGGGGRRPARPLAVTARLCGLSPGGRAGRAGEQCASLWPRLSPQTPAERTRRAPGPASRSGNTGTGTESRLMACSWPRQPVMETLKTSGERGGTGGTL